MNAERAINTLIRLHAHRMGIEITVQIKERTKEHERKHCN